MVHLDLLATNIVRFSDYIVADICSIPAEASSFDVVFCVGSVLNYSNPVLGIRELGRVLRPGGLLILEYERSGSPEYWWKHGPSAVCVCVDTFYGRVETQLWAYGDQFIDTLLVGQGLQTVKEFRFHAISSIILALTGSPTIASRFVLADSGIANIWPFKHVASNRMLAVKKPAGQRD
jgi:SAM-dependent methyltransferase